MRAAEEAATRLRDGILGGEFRPGDDLPGERELATRLGVSRLTLRAALTRLEAEGLVRPVHGSGTLVLDFHRTGGIELLGHLATGALATGTPSPAVLLRDLLEVRRAIAVEVIALAAERASEPELRALAAHVDRQAELVDDPPAYMASDLELARMLVRATHNLALQLLANTVARVVERQPGIEAAFAADPRGAISVYRRILELLAGRDPRAARRSVGRLLSRLDRAIVTRVAAFAAAGEVAP